MLKKYFSLLSMFILKHIKIENSYFKLSLNFTILLFFYQINVALVSRILKINILTILPYSHTRLLLSQLLLQRF